MMVLIELILIILYCINPIIGFVGVSALIVYNLLNKDKKKEEKIIECLFYMLPFSYQSFFTKDGATYLNFFFLFEITLLILCALNLKNVKKSKIFISMILIIAITFVRTMLTNDIVDSLKAVVNFWIMLIIPILLYYSKINYKNSENLKKMYKQVCLASSIALIISFLMYKIFGITMGNVTFFGNGNHMTQRVNFNLLFHSFSSLSAYLATGAILLLVDIFDGKYENQRPLNIALIIIEIIAIGLSSSRTGLVTFAAISFLFIICNKDKVNIKTILFIVGLGIIGFVYMIITRPGAINIFYNNGRFERWLLSLKYFSKNILFGTGFRDSTMALAHNFVLEFLTQGGIIVFGLLGYILFKYLIKIKKSNLKYLVWASLFANLFFTCLQGQTYFNLINIMLIIYLKNEKEARRKVGILTLYGNNNFGNKLQNYAIQEILNKKNICNETIVFEDNMLKKIIKKVLKKENNEGKYKNKCFKKFNKLINYTDWSIDLSDRFTDKLWQYSNLLYGSDQIWKYGRNGVSNVLIGLAGTKQKNIAFAASFGISNIPEKFYKKYQKGLGTFKAISVREERGKELIYELTEKKDVTVIVDPTMMLTKEEWKKISKKPQNYNGEKYILNYFLGNLSDEKRKVIENYAEEKKLEIINILDKNDKYYNVGPAEFVYLEENATLICTDSFHSCVFGILMQTPFIVFERDDNNASMNSRIETLIKKFEFNERKYCGIINDKIVKCDFAKSQTILEEERIKATMFLENALNKEVNCDEKRSN